jgi:transketolase
MIYELAKQDERIVFIGSDLGAGVLDEFKRDMPDRFFMEGVAEQNLVGMAAGMALSGKIVYVNTIATFLTRRAFEQVCIDVGLHHANVRLIGNGGGAVYAPLGPTHMATDDIALMRTIPSMTILCPADAVEMEPLMVTTVDYQGPIYLRLGKGGDPVLPSDRVLGDSGTLILSTGTVSQLAYEAARLTESTFLHLTRVKPIDWEWIAQDVGSYDVVVTVEDHSIIGGLGSAVAETLSESGFTGILRRIGYPDVFPSGYGTQDEMRAAYGISVDNIVKVVKELRGQPR